MPLVLLLQSAQAVAVSSPGLHVSDYLTYAASVLILAMQSWMLRTLVTMRDELRIVVQALFGRRGDNGIEKTVETHSAELLEHDRRITDTEGRLDRIDPDQRSGPADRRHV